jgi:hypothetical protein
MTPERVEVAVHPNSMAARKWKRKSWSTTAAIYAEASRAKKAGDQLRAQALRRAAGRAAATTVHCG